MQKKLDDWHLLNLLKQTTIRLSSREEDEAFISYIRGLLAKHGAEWITQNCNSIIRQWTIWRNEWLETGRKLSKKKREKKKKKK